MDSAEIFGQEDYTPLICGEESFGTGSSHIREKDGVWAVLCWLSLLAKQNESTMSSGKLISVRDIVIGHWKRFGRNVYCRYDYEGVDKTSALKMMARLTGIIDMWRLSGNKPVTLPAGNFVLSKADEFEYHDPVDKSVTRNQGWRFIMSDGSRFVFRLSGTGSVGATIRLYLEKYIKNNAPEALLLANVQDALRSCSNCYLVATALQRSSQHYFI